MTSLLFILQKTALLACICNDFFLENQRGMIQYNLYAHHTLTPLHPSRQQRKTGASSFPSFQYENTKEWVESQSLGVQMVRSANLELTYLTKSPALVLNLAIASALSPLAVFFSRISLTKSLKAFCQSAFSKLVSSQPKASIRSLTFSTGLLPPAAPSSSSSFLPPKAFPHPTSTLTSPLTTILLWTSQAAPSKSKVIGQESEMTSVPVMMSSKILILLQQSILLYYPNINFPINLNILPQWKALNS